MPCGPMSHVGSSTVATPSSSMRATIAAGSANVSSSPLRTLIGSPARSIAPSQIALRSGRKQFDR